MLARAAIPRSSNLETVILLMRSRTLLWWDMPPEAASVAAAALAVQAVPAMWLLMFMPCLKVPGTRPLLPPPFAPPPAGPCPLGSSPSHAALVLAVLLTVPAQLFALVLGIPRIRQLVLVPRMLAPQTLALPLSAPME